MGMMRESYGSFLENFYLKIESKDFILSIAVNNFAEVKPHQNQPNQPVEQPP